MGEAGERSRWTPRRVVRSAGVVAILISALMTLFGTYGPPADFSPKAFWVYWTIFFLFLLGALGLAMVDAMITIVKFRKEHKDLREMAGDTMRGGRDKVK